ncbi:MAG: chloride channel protein [Thiomargarita sp.]|nr:chloride channel protein [Thiomargarita sp.]
MFSYPSITAPRRHIQLLWQQQRTKSIVNIAVIFLLAPVIGVGAGVGAIFIEHFVKTLSTILFEEKLWGLLNMFGSYNLVIIPTIGGLIVGLTIFHFAREARRRSVPELLKAVALKDEDIPPRALAIKSIMSAVYAATGGSVGLGGPTGQLGSAFGATVGHLLALDKKKTRLLFACGIGAGIGAAFHAPIMSSIFVVEVILGYFSIITFGAILLASFTADFIAQFYKEEFLVIPHHEWVSFWEIPLYCLLAIIVSISVKIFTKMMGKMRTFWEMLAITDYFKPMLGGLIIGMIGLVTFQVDGLPRIFGLGSTTLLEALNGTLAIQIIFLIFLLKMLTTSLSLGSSGGAGGTFTPAFFMGATLGGSFGYLVGFLFPEITSPSAVYAMAGMAAFVGGVFNAPLTALLIGFEVIGHYHIVWSVMLTVLFSTLFTKMSNHQYRKNLYSIFANNKRTYMLLQLLKFFCRYKVAKKS